MKVRIDSVADYRLHLGKLISKKYPKANDKAKEAVIAMLLSAFSEGMALRSGKLEVEI